MKPISAQISIYPLRQQSLTGPIEGLVSTLRSRGLQVQPGTMSTIVSGDVESLFDGLKQAFEQAAEHAHIVMVATFSNACPLDDHEP
ncbi:MAG TPA: YkoF family thiamine/hydroxymethylpyrimidine-binding protein [Vicinamibacteria bacterium]